MPIPHDLFLVEGDVVSVRATVKHKSRSGEVYLRVEGEYQTIAAAREHAQVVTTILSPGDEVRAAEAVLLAEAGDEASASRWPYGTVVAIHEGQAWIEWLLGSSVEKASDLRRIRTRQQVKDCDPRPGDPPAPGPDFIEPASFLAQEPPHAPL